MLLMLEKGIRGGTCHAVHWYTKSNNKYMKIYLYSVFRWKQFVWMANVS